MPWSRTWWRRSASSAFPTPNSKSCSDCSGRCGATSWRSSRRRRGRRSLRRTKRRLRCPDGRRSRLDTLRRVAPSPRRLFLVPHTHWDREWYLPFEAFRERLVEMMDGLIELLDHEPRFAHFHLDGQTAMIRDYLDVRPEREPDIQRLARAGKLSVGPWFTQMDEFLVSGESLVRNLEWGLADTRDLAGLEPTEAIGYLPDQFGHVAQMPQ